MKRKLFAVGVVVVVCLSLLVVEGVSQPPSHPPKTVGGEGLPQPPSRPPASAPGPAPTPPSATQANFSTVAPQQQAQTFEQLADALRAVRARQKELKAQEADLLAKMAEKVEEKRRDLEYAQEILQALRGGGELKP